MVDFTKRLQGTRFGESDAFWGNAQLSGDFLPGLFVVENQFDHLLFTGVQALECGPERPPFGVIHGELWMVAEIGYQVGSRWILANVFTNDVSRDAGDERSYGIQSLDLASSQGLDHTEKRLVADIFGVSGGPHLAQRQEVNSVAETGFQPFDRVGDTLIGSWLVPTRHFSEQSYQDDHCWERMEIRAFHPGGTGFGVQPLANQGSLSPEQANGP